MCHRKHQGTEGCFFVVVVFFRLSSEKEVSAGLKTQLSLLGSNRSRRD